MTKTIKRDGTLVEFNREKIYNAIMKAMKLGSGIVSEPTARLISLEAENKYGKVDTVSIFEIETFVFERLVHHGHELTAKAYEGYRAIQSFKRETNTTDNSILGLIRGTNKEVINENSNKNGYISSTQRDLIAGEVSKDLSRRHLIPAHIVQAHDEGVIHYHDMDYALQQIPNCCLVNLKDMLDNGTVINGKRVDSPNSFLTACTIATQIMAQIAGGQYGGQTSSLSHLAPYVRKSKERYYNLLKDSITNIDDLNNAVDKLLKKEVASGVQTIQYQIQTLATANGQSPFVSLFMYLNEDEEYIEEMAMIVEEVLKQRILGVKNEQGVYVSPAFPKLLYVLDDNNTYEGSEYYYLTQLAVECVSKRIVPDFISAKKMKEHYDGEVYPCMGCRSFLSPWKDENGQYKWYGRQNLGVITLNLVDVALSSKGDTDVFWNIFNERLELCKEAILLRVDLLRGASSGISPIHWQHGAIARLGKDETIDKVIDSGACSISLGYIGLCEAVRALIGESHTSPKGEKLAIEIMQHMRATVDKWKAETGYGFGLYGTPSESLTYRFATKLKQRHGFIEGITDKNYITNSYHVHVCEEIDAFSKMAFESQFQKISSGGTISYIEVPNMKHNLDALHRAVEFMYENMQYCEINTKSDYCQVCGYDGEIKINDDFDWYCPNCNNMDKNKMNVVRRTCGYLGENFWNLGRTHEIKERVLHMN